MQTLGIQGRSNHGFERKRKAWETDLAEALGKLEPSPKVPRQTLLRSEQQIAHLENEITKVSQQASMLEDKITALEKLRPVAMIIEPEPLVVEDLRQLLDEEGFVLAGVARTEKEAIELAKTARPDIIVSETVLADASSDISSQKNLEFHHAYPSF